MTIKLTGCYSCFLTAAFLLLWPAYTFGQFGEEYSEGGLFHSLIPGYEYDDFGGIHNPGKKPVDLRVGPGGGERQVIRIKPGETLKVEIASSVDPIPSFAVLDEMELPNPWTKQWWYVSESEWDERLRLRPGFPVEWDRELVAKIQAEVKTFGLEPKADETRSLSAYGKNIILFEIARNVIEREIRTKYPHENFEYYPLRFGYGNFFDYYLIGTLEEQNAAENAAPDSNKPAENNGNDPGTAVIETPPGAEGYTLEYVSELSPEFQIFLSAVLETALEPELLVFEYVGSNPNFSIIELAPKYFSLKNRTVISEEKNISVAITEIFNSLGIKELKKEVIGENSGHPKLRYTSKKWKAEGRVPGLESIELELAISVQLDLDFHVFLLNEELGNTEGEDYDATLGTEFELRTLLDLKFPNANGKQITLVNEYDDARFMFEKKTKDEKTVENEISSMTQKETINLNDPKFQRLLHEIDRRIHKTLEAGNHE